MYGLDLIGVLKLYRFLLEAVIVADVDPSSLGVFGISIIPRSKKRSPSE